MKKLQYFLAILFLFSFATGFSQIVISGPSEICPNKLVTFSISGISGSGTTSYVISDGSGNAIESGFVNGTVLSTQFNSVGGFILTITHVTDPGGVTEMADYTILVNNCPSIEVTTSCDYAYLCLTGYDLTLVGSYQWSIDGVTYQDTSESCIEVYGLAPGTHFVELVLYDWMGEIILFDDPNGNISESIVQEFYILDGEPIFLYSDAANFCPGGQSSGGCEKVCEFTTVNYYVEDLGSAGQFFWWEVIGAVSWTEIAWGQIEVVWGEAGTGQVTVFPEQTGCSFEASICVEILESPEASFTTTPDAVGNELTICQGQEVHFDNTTTGAVYYEWSFGDGVVTSDPNPEHTYDVAGTYDVELIAKNECLCADTTSLTVIVEPTLAPFVDCVGTICGIDTFTYTSSADCTDFFWTVSSNGNVISGGNTGDNFIAIEWLSGPIGEIELSVDNCNGSYCLSPSMIQIPIMSGDAEIVGATEVCKGSAEIYKIQDYSATYYNWSISEGQIISGQGTNEVAVVWDSPNSLPTNAQITVEYENCYLECGGQDVLDVTIVDEFLVAGPIEVCPDAIEAYSTVKIFGAGNVMSNWDLLDDQGVSVWSFNNAETTNIAFPPTPGMYKLVVEAVTPTDYCKPSYEIVINIIDKTDPPTGVEGELSICQGSTYQYEATTVDPTFQFDWTITDGVDIIEKTGNPISVTWNSSGPYELFVTQTDFSRLPCASEGFTQTIEAITLLELDGPTDVCDQEISHFVATYIEYTDYTWEIIPETAGVVVGDDDKSEIDIQWYGAQAAEVRVSLCGLAADVALTIHPLPEPEVSHPLELCANETGSVDVNAVFDSYAWYNTDRVEVSNVDKPDLLPGTYELVVTDINGCTGNTSFTIEALPIPNIRISSPDPLGLCLIAPHTYPVLYGLDSESGYTYQWYLDGTALVGEVGPIHNSAVVGLYQLEVTDIKGCKNSSNILNVFDCCDPAGGACLGGGGGGGGGFCLNTNGTADFSATQGAFCNTYDFTNLSTDFVLGSTYWNFGDEAVSNDFSTDENPSYTFSNAGFYTVYFQNRVDDLDNPGVTCKLWDAEIVRVEAAAHFDVDRACPNEVVKFYDLSTFIPGNNIVSWDWNFGDPTSGSNTSTDQDPTHVFDNPGTYEIVLTIGTGSCISTFADSITIHPKPVVTVPQPDVVCARTSIKLEGLTTGYVTEWAWDFGDPTSGDKNISIVQEAYHEFDNPGIYDITLDAENIYGCTERFMIQVEIEPNDLIGDVASNNSNPMCEGEEAILTSPGGGVSWLWSTGETTETLTVTEEDIYSVTVVDINGCTHTPDDYVLTLIPKPNSAVRGVIRDDYGQPLDYIYDQIDVCHGEDVFIEAILYTDYTYVWSSGENGNEIEFSEDRGNLLDVGTHEFTVEITDNLTGCTNVVGPYTVEVHALPADVVITASPAGTLCAGELSTLTVSTVDPSLNYIWSNGLTGPTIDVSMAGEYFVIAVNSYGCQTESNHIEIMNAPDIGLIPDGCLEQCNPDTLCLPAIPNISTYQWFFNGVAIGAPEGQTPDLVADASGVYYVELVDVFGCMATSDPFTLELIDPVGTVDGEVYFDVNQNGVIDGGDTVMENVGVILENTNNTFNTVTDALGVYSFVDVPSETYNIHIDPATIDATYLVYNDSLQIDLIGCEAMETVQFLVYPTTNTIVEVDTALVFCYNDGITFNGVWISNDTTYLDTLTSPGVDSIFNITAVEMTELEFVPAFKPSCFGEDNGAITLGNIQGGQGPYEYSIDGINFQTGLVFDNLPSGPYTITMRDGLLCTQDVNVDLESLEELLWKTEAVESCFGETNGSIIMSEITGGLAPYEFSIDGVNFQSTLMFDNLPPALYTVTIKDGSYCTNDLQIQVESLTELQAGVEESKTCYDQTNGNVEVLNVSGGQGPYLYSIDGTNYQVDNVFENLGANNYIVYIEDDRGCSTTINAQVQEAAEILITLDAGKSCFNSNTGQLEVALTGGEGAISYSLNGVNYQPSNIFTSLSSGQFEVFVKDELGCEVIESIEIEEIEEIDYQLDGGVLDCDVTETSIDLDINNPDVSILWEDGSVDNQLIVTTPGVYQVEISNTCQQIFEQIEIKSELESTEGVYVPTAFSPNADGVNDSFSILADSDAVMTKARLDVYDRWGSCVYHTNNPSEEWNGTVRNKLLLPGIYVYTLKLDLDYCHEIKQITKQGEITVLR